MLLLKGFEWDLLYRLKNWPRGWCGEWWRERWLSETCRSDKWGSWYMRWLKGAAISSHVWNLPLTFGLNTIRFLSQQDLVLCPLATIAFSILIKLTTLAIQEINVIVSRRSKLAHKCCMSICITLYRPLLHGIDENAQLPIPLLFSIGKVTCVE